jgi:hypothetical protein
MLPKPTGRVRDKDYLAFVHTLACASRSLPGAECEGPIEASHMGRRPVGRKADDDTCIAQCRRCHTNFGAKAGPFRDMSPEQIRTWADHQIAQTRQAYTRLHGEVPGTQGRRAVTVAAKGYMNEKQRHQARERNRRWRAKPETKERQRAYQRLWRERNPERARELKRQWRAKNREKVRASAKRWREKSNYRSSPARVAQSLKDWLKTYGLTVSAYHDLVAAQSGRCAICEATSSGRRGSQRLLVDHCHATGVVRGLLCFFCNTLLGNAKDSPDRLRVAAAYLERWR